MAHFDGTRKIAQVGGGFFTKQVFLQHVPDEIGHRSPGARREFLQGAMLLRREVDGQARTTHDIMISKKGALRAAPGAGTLRLAAGRIWWRHLQLRIIVQPGLPSFSASTATGFRTDL